MSSKSGKPAPTGFEIAVKTISREVMSFFLMGIAVAAFFVKTKCTMGSWKCETSYLMDGWVLISTLVFGAAGISLFGKENFVAAGAALKGKVFGNSNPQAIAPPDPLQVAKPKSTPRKKASPGSAPE